LNKRVCDDVKAVRAFILDQTTRNTQMHQNLRNRQLFQGTVNPTRIKEKVEPPIGNLSMNPAAVEYETFAYRMIPTIFQDIFTS